MNRLIVLPGLFAILTCASACLVVVEHQTLAPPYSPYVPSCPAFVGYHPYPPVIPPRVLDPSYGISGGNPDGTVPVYPPRLPPRAEPGSSVIHFGGAGARPPVRDEEQGVDVINFKN